MRREPPAQTKYAVYSQFFHGWYAGEHEGVTCWCPEAYRHVWLDPAPALAVRATWGHREARVRHVQHTGTPTVYEMLAGVQEAPTRIGLGLVDEFRNRVLDHGKQHKKVSRMAIQRSETAWVVRCPCGWTASLHLNTCNPEAYAWLHLRWNQRAAWLEEVLREARMLRKGQGNPYAQL